MVYLSFRENLNLKSFNISDSEYLLMEFVKIMLKDIFFNDKKNCWIESFV